MSLRRQSVGTPGMSRVRQPFKSPFRSPVPTDPSKEGSSTPTLKRAGINKYSRIPSSVSNVKEEENKCLITDSAQDVSRIAGEKTSGTSPFSKVSDSENTVACSSTKMSDEENTITFSDSKVMDDERNAICLTPLKESVSQSSGQRDYRRKSLIRNFSTPFRSPTSQPQSQSISSLEEQLAHLTRQEAELDPEILELQDSGIETDELQYHIDNLHKYNEIKDAAQLVFGRLAQMEEVTVKEMHNRYGITQDE